MNNILQEIANKEKLLKQADELKKKKFSPGFDGMTAEKAYIWFEINSKKIIKEIADGNYEPMPIVGFNTAKKNGGYRRFVKMTAIDTIIQNTFIDSIKEFCEEKFSDYSFAYRENRGVSSALEQYCIYAENYKFAAKTDPISCFDNIDKNILKERLNQFFNNEKITDFIMRFVNIPVLVDGVFDYPEKGVFQGLAISNLLCNIYFDLLDKTLEKQEIPFVRYGDDVIIFANSTTEITQYHDLVKNEVTKNMKLKINQQKSKIDSVANLTFLGHRFEKKHKTVTVLDTNNNASNAYANWYESTPFNFRNTYDILSDGILRQKDYSLIFDNDFSVSDIPVKNTDVINIYSNVVFDTGFFNKIHENNITVNVFSKNNKLIGRFIPNTVLKSPTTTNEQLSKYNNEHERLFLAKEFILASIHNTRLNIRYYKKQNEHQNYTNALAFIDAMEEKIKKCENYNELLLLEAQVREKYYSCFDNFIKNDEFIFDKRSRRPPKNEVNSLLSFGNVVLYNFIATQIYKSSLDIRVGFLHATNNRKESLNLDFAEIFKPLIVDRIVFSLINLKSFNTAHFYKNENDGVYLNEEGKRIFLRAFYEKLNTTLIVDETHKSYYSIIKNEIRQLEKGIKNNSKYKAFRQVR